MTYEERKLQICKKMAKLLDKDFDTLPEGTKNMMMALYEAEADISLSFALYCYNRGFKDGNINKKGH